MKLEVKVSTLIVFILSQTFLSLMFYAHDKYIGGVDAIMIFILSLPMTFFIQWLRDEFNFIDPKNRL